MTLDIDCSVDDSKSLTNFNEVGMENRDKRVVTINDRCEVSVLISSPRPGL